MQEKVFNSPAKQFNHPNVGFLVNPYNLLVETLMKKQLRVASLSF